jgi:hypothetical protein
MNKIILRAITAFSRPDLKGSEGQLSMQGREIHYLGKDYVALETESAQELLALYRCMNRGELKRLKRWPAELTSKTPDPSTKNLAANIQKTPAILELSPVKKEGKVEKSKKRSGRASSTPTNQSDLFE